MTDRFQGVTYTVIDNSLICFRIPRNDGSGANRAPKSGSFISGVDWYRYKSVAAGGDAIVYAVEQRKIMQTC
jgi:hypothetical protein